ncbi:MAG: P-II family nitrogen regulator [Candidatus Omnitrophica bacterium]|nr:P-II family nitrogen regulator [Candidatus Omnitrophota bacterium]
MKKLECIIRPEKFDEVCAALRKTGVGGLTITKIQGFGKSRAIGRGSVDKVKIEVYVDDFQAKSIIEIIMHAAYSGKTGDGKIAIIPLEKIYRIRTGEKGARAI